MTISLMSELALDGCLHQSTDVRVLDGHLDEARRVVYCGFDPTAPSLHAGHLLSLTVMRRFLERGHRVIGLIGSATARIGDPSFRTGSRRVMDRVEVAENAGRVKASIERILGPHGDLVVLDNAEWLDGIGHLQFMEEVGRHFTLSRMLGFEGVRSRLDGEGSMSFPEFGYMLLQAADFLELNRRMDCTVQIGGSDEWGNMVNGVDLVRKAAGREAMALTTPLLTTSDGRKMGKSAGGAVWLDAGMTSPDAFWQFWRDMPDRDACGIASGLLSRSVAEEAASEGPNALKIAVADAMTRFVHGTARPAIESRSVPHEVKGLPAALVSIGLAVSVSEARRLARQGAVRIDGVKASEGDAVPPTGALVSVGRRKRVRIGPVQ